MQISLNEQIIFYKKIANDLLKEENSHTFQSDYMVSAISVDDDFCYDFFYEVQYMGIWIYDQYSTNENLDDTNKDVKLQVIPYSNIIPNLDTILEVTWRDSSPYFFYFEKTELYITFPLSYECDASWIGDINNHSDLYEHTNCIDENGEYYKFYKLKCESFFFNLLKSRTSVFDNNYLSSQNKTIFINNYHFSEYDYDEYYELSLCIEFDDPITRGKGYACTFSSYYNLYLSLNELNSNMKGYFFISNIGFNNMFFFPESKGISQTSTQYIFNWNYEFFLDEKVKFYFQIKNFFSTNYIENIDDVYDEIYLNGKNSNDQYFSINGKMLNYSIYPIIVENERGFKEHILSIIYIYNTSIYFEGLKKYESSMTFKIITQLILIIIFYSGLLYLIYISFNTLLNI